MFLRVIVRCVLAAAVASCARPNLNVALVTVEALRCDAIGFYGGSGVTRWLDSLAAESVVFSHAQVPQGHTWPSLTSLHTSTYPAHHGVRRNGQPMPRPLPTLATALAKNGYSTGAFLGNMASAEHPGFQRVFKGRFPSLPQHRWDKAITQGALAWVDSVGEPFFLWNHYVGPHTPYLPQSDPQPDYRGPITGTVESLSALSVGLFPATTENMSRVRSLYLGDVRSVDAQVGQLCAALNTRGLLGRTIVVVTADHGEELGAPQPLHRPR